MYPAWPCTVTVIDSWFFHHEGGRPVDRMEDAKAELELDLGGKGFGSPAFPADADALSPRLTFVQGSASGLYPGVGRMIGGGGKVVRIVEVEMEFMASMSRLGVGSSFVPAREATFSMLTSAITSIGSI